MRPIYSVRLDAAPPPGEGAAAVAPALRSAVERWLLDEYWRAHEVVPALPMTGGAVEPWPGHRVEVEARAAAGAFQWSLAWSRPAGGAARWRTECAIAHEGGETELSVAVGLAAEEISFAPVRESFEPPALVRDLCARLDCRVGGWPVPIAPRMVHAPGVEAFVAECLTAPERTLPVVALSAGPDGRYACDPAELAARLTGLAAVACLADAWAARRLMDEIGRLEACYHGAARIYPPRFAPERGCYTPALLPADLAALRAAHGTTARGIAARVAEAAALGLGRGRVERRAAAAFARADEAAFAEVRRKAVEARDLDALLALADEELARVRAEKERLASRVEALERALGEARGPYASHAAAPAAEEAEPKSVREAVERARARFAEALVFTDAALASAAESPFKRPRKVLRALEAMSEVALLWRASRERKEPLGSLEKAFRERGFDYRARESMTSKGKWREEYEAAWNGAKVSIQQHLALGTGGPESCLRIHFHADESSGKLVVHHVGRHKTNTLS